MSQTAKTTRPAEGEAPFGIDEVFFSRTDPRGVIQSGNEVFRRVADYEWPQMIGAPHRIIRHPDMPRGVFQLLWDRLKAGLIVGAYVKNKARDGLHYWVFAVISPTDGGYLSVRIRPTSALFPEVRNLYAELLALEKSQSLGPEDSATALLQRIADLGFADYDAFMAAALSREIAARDGALDRRSSDWRGHLTRLTEDTDRLATECEALNRQFESIRAIPINLGIAAVSLGDAGRPITVIAENYAMMCREVFDKLATLRASGLGGFAAIVKATREAHIMNGAAQLQEEAAADFDAETEESPVDRAEEIARLSEQTAAMKTRAFDSLRGVKTQVTALRATFRDLGRLVEGLDVTRILCRVEGGRLPPARAADLTGIIASLDSFHSGLSKRLETLEDLAGTMADTASALGAEDRRRIPRTAAA
jgi:hypothetical protein